MAVNKTIILDSNIIIYTGLVEYQSLRNWLESKNVCVSSISQIEVLGYHNLIPTDQIYFEAFFRQCQIFSVTPEIVNLVIELRQQKAMSLGDSIIAATSILKRLPLVTVNDKDFKHLNNLEVINPI